MFNENESSSIIREKQTKYFSQCIEIANRDYHLPVLLGISLYDEPHSNAYHTLRTGRFALKPKVPEKCKKPFVFAFCRGSATVKWLPPEQTAIDPPIIAYKIAWRPGGSKELGFNQIVDVDTGSCIEYLCKRDENGIQRTTALKERKWVISGLNADVPYEFKVMAINEMGDGPWSDATEPIILPNPPKVLNYI